ncbi:MAG: leucine-rich repeat domain-containing protein [Holosporales bacterium]
MKTSSYCRPAELPVEIHEHILNQNVISQGELLKLRLVSKTYDALAIEALTKQRPDSFLSCDLTNKKQVQSLVAWIKRLEKSAKTCALKPSQGAMNQILDNCSLFLESGPLVLRGLDLSLISDKKIFERKQSLCEFLSKCCDLRVLKSPPCAELERCVASLMPELPHLTTLKFDAKYLSRELYREILSACTDVKKLIWHRYYPSVYGDDFFEKWQGLTHVDLIESSLPEATLMKLVQNSGNLEALGIRGIKALKPEEFTHLAKLKNLKDLDLSQTSVNDDALEAIVAGCAALEHLNLRYCLGLSMSFSALPKLSHLRALNVAGTALSAHELALLAEGEHAGQIRELDLTKIETIQADAFKVLGSMDNLQRLKLSMTKINDAGLLPILTQCVHLQELDLSHCRQLTPESFSNITQLSSLHVLNVANTKIKAETIFDIIIQLGDHLHCIYMRGSPDLSEEMHNRILAKLPSSVTVAKEFYKDHGMFALYSPQAKGRAMHRFGF